MAEKIECEYTNEIVCPWCGYEYSDSWEFHEDREDMECPECEKMFNMNRTVTVSYTTERKECETCVMESSEYYVLKRSYEKVGKEWVWLDLTKDNWKYRHKLICNICLNEAIMFITKEEYDKNIKEGK